MLRRCGRHVVPSRGVADEALRRAVHRRTPGGVSVAARFESRNAPRGFESGERGEGTRRVFVLVRFFAGFRFATGGSFYLYAAQRRSLEHVDSAGRQSQLRVDRADRAVARRARQHGARILRRLRRRQRRLRPQCLARADVSCGADAVPETQTRRRHGHGGVSFGNERLEVRLESRGGDEVVRLF